MPCLDQPTLGLVQQVLEIGVLDAHSAETAYQVAQIVDATAGETGPRDQVSDLVIAAHFAVDQIGFMVCDEGERGKRCIADPDFNEDRPIGRSDSFSAPKCLSFCLDLSLRDPECQTVAAVATPVERSHQARCLGRAAGPVYVLEDESPGRGPAAMRGEPLQNKGPDPTSATRKRIPRGRHRRV